MTQSTSPAPATTGRWGSFGLPAQRGADPSATIDAACRNLGLSTIRGRWEEFAAQALREHASYADFLAELLESECEDRDERRKFRRVKEAGFPRNKRIEDFDFSKNPNVPPEVINTLAQPGWVQAGNPLCLIGDTGTGKSHLLIGLGTAIAEAGGRVRYTTAANLVNELAEAASDKQLGRTIKKYGRVDLLCLDLCQDRDYAERDSSGTVVGGRKRIPVRHSLRHGYAQVDGRCSWVEAVPSAAWVWERGDIVWACGTSTRCVSDFERGQKQIPNAGTSVRGGTAGCSRRRWPRLSWPSSSNGTVSSSRAPTALSLPRWAAGALDRHTDCTSSAASRGPTRRAT
ncbi:ATP-binding protein [Streptomyces sp. NPDC017254]|uniref:ATP-binding protein n=1 Tax=unclassified Streptomyces TaxID=2593676 RepID=UPI0037B14C02